MSRAQWLVFGAFTIPILVTLAIGVFSWARRQVDGRSRRMARVYSVLDETARRLVDGSIGPGPALAVIDCVLKSLTPREIDRARQYVNRRINEVALERLGLGKGAK